MPQRGARQPQQPQYPRQQQQPLPQQPLRLPAVLRLLLLLLKHLLQQRVQRHPNLRSHKVKEVLATVALATITQVCSNNI